MFFSIIFPNPGRLSTRASRGLCIINLHWIKFLFSLYGASHTISNILVSTPPPVTQSPSNAHRALISISVRGNTAMGTIHSSYLGVSSVYEETLLLNILDSGMWLIIKLTSNHHISSSCSCLSLYNFLAPTGAQKMPMFVRFKFV